MAAIKAYLKPLLKGNKLGLDLIIERAFVHSLENDVKQSPEPAADNPDNPDNPDIPGGKSGANTSRSVKTARSTKSTKSTKSGKNTSRSTGRGKEKEKEQEQEKVIEDTAFKTTVGPFQFRGLLWFIRAYVDLWILFTNLDDDAPDTIGSGEVSFDEFSVHIQTLREWGLVVPDEDLESTFKMVDTDNSGSLDFDEFSEWLLVPLMVKEQTRAAQEILKEKQSEGFKTEWQDGGILLSSFMSLLTQRKLIDSHFLSLERVEQLFAELPMRPEPEKGVFSPQREQGPRFGLASLCIAIFQLSLCRCEEQRMMKFTPAHKLYYFLENYFWKLIPTVMTLKIRQTLCHKNIQDFYLARAPQLWGIWRRMLGAEPTEDSKVTLGQWIHFSQPLGKHQYTALTAARCFGMCLVPPGIRLDWTGFLELLARSSLFLIPQGGHKHGPHEGGAILRHMYGSLAAATPNSLLNGLERVLQMLAI